MAKTMAAHSRKPGILNAVPGKVRCDDSPQRMIEYDTSVLSVEIRLIEKL